MLDLQTHWPALLEFLMGPAARVWLIVFGLLAAGHYHAMANATKRAPLLIKYVALPLLTGAGIGMVWAGVTGNLLAGGLYSSAAAGLMVTVNLAAFGAGAYVSVAFEQAAEVRERINREGWAFVRQFDQLAEAAKILESDHAPLEDTKRRERT